VLDRADLEVLSEVAASGNRWEFMLTANPAGPFVSERGVLSTVWRAMEIRFAAKPKIGFARVAGRPPARLRAEVC
jgi:hypothetical protein